MPAVIRLDVASRLSDLSGMTSDRLVLGTAALGLKGREHAFEILDEYVRLGGRTIDTAAIYSDWVPGETRRSERVLGEWLKARGNRDELTIITKGCHPQMGTTASRLDAASIRHDVDLSLQLLGTDAIDLWFLHKHDPAADVPEIVGTLRDLHRQGKVRAFGSSNWPVARMAEARAIPGETFSANQVLGNVFARLIAGPPDPTNLAIDAPMFRYTVESGMGLYLYSATAHGYFERRAAGRAPAREYDLPSIAEAASRLEAIAAEAGVRPSELIVAALLALAPSVHAIVAASSVEQLRQTWKGGQVALGPDIVRQVAAATGMSDFIA
jgi:aryl-alcohol dehydrogenase-like predicted oxidoreductase